MNTTTLQQNLIAEGCNPNKICIGERDLMDDVYCLRQVEGEWQVSYVERGQFQEPEFTSHNEDEACQFYYNFLMNMQHWHLVAAFEHEPQLIKTQEQLEQAGIKPIRNDMPPMGANRPTVKRLFVVGKDIFKAQALYKDLPLTDTVVDGPPTSNTHFS